MSAQLVCRRCGAIFEAKRSDAKYCTPCKELGQKARGQVYERRKRSPCPGCGQPMVRGANLCRSCDNKARVERYAGQNNPNWGEGRSKTRDGYVTVRVKAGSPGKGKGAFYRPEHRVVWERTHGKTLPKGWVVHHLNGIKDDNRPQNLLAVPRHEHHKHPREVLRRYEARIRNLEEELKEVRQLRLNEPHR